VSRTVTSPNISSVPVVFYAIAGVLASTGIGMIVSGVRNERKQPRPDLTERLLPFAPSVADEAQVWLRGGVPTHVRTC
jgi:hypothetical protein